MRTELEKLEIVLHGEAALMQHNRALANPLSPGARRLKALSSKRRKTDEDLGDLARAEFEESFYWDAQLGPIVECGHVLACLIEGAKKSKLGKEANLGIFIEAIGKNGAGGDIKLEYDGPRDKARLWNGGVGKFVSSELVNVNRARILRTRPIFPEWSLHFLVKFDPNVINRESIIKALQDAGFYAGLLERRPRCGRFSVEVVK
jgi:hypothetical protein